MDSSPLQCASSLLDVVPAIVHEIRANMRSHRGSDLTIPQFRTLAFLGRHEASMLTDVAAFLGLTLASTSKLVDGVVKAGLATRKIDKGDRRRVVLALTAAGHRTHTAALAFTREFLAEKVAHLPERARTNVIRAMESLRQAFADPAPEHRAKGRSFRARAARPSTP